MAKQLAYSSEARKHLKSGIDQLANAVRVTLGPQGRNVILDNPDVARDVHEYLVRFMRETSVPEHLLKPRLELRI